MPELFTLRNSLLAIIGISTGILVWLAAEFWLDAYRQRTDAVRLLASNEVESLLLTGAEHWALERGLAHFGLHKLGAVPSEIIHAVSEHRASADRAYREALRLLTTTGISHPGASLIAEIEQRYNAVAETRKKVDFLITQPFGPRWSYDYGVKPQDHPLIAVIDAWFPSVTALISTAQRLGSAVPHRARVAVRDIEALQDLKHAAWSMREFAERDRALIAALIATADPLINEDTEKLFVYRGRLEQAWMSVKAYAGRPDASAAVASRIQRVQQSYFTAFEAVRRPIIGSVRDGTAYPTSAEDWYRQSGTAMESPRQLGATVETVARDLTLERVTDAERRLMLVSTILIFSVLLAGFSIWVVVGRVVRPLHRITLAMMALSSGDATIAVPETAQKGEIRAMARSVRFFKETIEAQTGEINDAKNSLEDKIKQRTRELETANLELAEKSNSMETLSKQLSKYLSPQIYKSIFSGEREVKVASQRKKLTIFFSDIVGFTETVDRLESEELTALLNQYLTEMSEIALAHGATIDKYVGDGIVIFFGDPDTLGVKQDALACVKMAITMRDKMDELQHAWHASGIEKPLQSRMGINTGYCTVGNFGSSDRLDYTIIGGDVNLASRLETIAAPGEILISYETFVHVEDEIRCKLRDEVQIRGIAYPVAIYNVIDSHENLRDKRHLLHDDLPHLKLDVELHAMSAEQADQAANVLREALDKVTGIGSRHGEKEDSD